MPQDSVYDSNASPATGLQESEVDHLVAKIYIGFDAPSSVSGRCRDMQVKCFAGKMSKTVTASFSGVTRVAIAFIAATHCAHLCPKQYRGSWPRCA